MAYSMYKLCECNGNTWKTSEGWVLILYHSRNMTGKVNIHTSIYIKRNMWQDITEGGGMVAGGDNIWRKGHSCRKMKKVPYFSVCRNKKLQRRHYRADNQR